jgi:hypothetical protein
MRGVTPPSRPYEKQYLKAFCSNEMALLTGYFGQRNESTKKAELEPGFENKQNLAEKLVTSRCNSKIVGYF